MELCCINTVCVPGCGGCSCSWRGCRCHCSSCYSRTSDPVCQSANAACRSLKQPFLSALDGARETVRLAGQSLNIAKEAFRAAESVANGASNAVQVAADSLDVVKDTFKVGAQLIGDIASFGLSELFALHEITFEAPLTAAAAVGGRFSLTVRATILGSSQKIRISADLNDITGTITRPLADKVRSGLGNLF